MISLCALITTSDSKNSFKTDRFVWWISSDVFLFFINMLDLFDVICDICHWWFSSFLFLLSDHDHSIFLLFNGFFSILWLLGLSVQEFHKRHLINHSVWVVYEDKFFLAVVQDFMSTFSWSMQNEEIRLFTLPRSGIFWVLCSVNLTVLFSLFQFFSSSCSPNFSIIFIWIIFFDHRRAVIPIFDRLIRFSLFATSFDENGWNFFESMITSCISYRSSTVRIFRHRVILFRIEIDARCGLSNLVINC